LSDSIISAWEIKRVLNGNPFIFLNACSSWRNDTTDFEKNGEDTVWIASSFLIGWAKWVLSTLWPVSDIVSMTFAIELYDYLLKNNTLWSALLSSKKEVYIQYPNDITWASFIYYWDLNFKIQ
jgi:CHAT domain-containing protein